MENNINIRIVRPDDEMGTPSQPSTPQPTTATATAPEKQKGGIGKMAGVSVAIGMAKQGVSLGLSQVAFETGSTHKQEMVNAGVKVLQHGIAFAINPVLGLGSLTMDLVTNTINYNQKRWEEELRIGRIMGRSGAEYNRSRR
jgi:hypothetical protein